MTVEIRDARGSDLEAVLSLWRSSEAPGSVTDDLPSLRALLAHPAAWLLLAREDERLVGTLIASWDGWRGGLYRLVVTPGARRKGIASALVAEGERRLAADGCRRLSILVLDAEEPAAAFWSASGYERDERFERYVRDLDGDHLGDPDLAR